VTQKEDPELIKKQKLLTELEKKNDEDSKKGLKIPVDPLKNETLLALVKNVTAKQKKLDDSKIPLASQKAQLPRQESRAQVIKEPVSHIKPSGKQVSLQDLQSKSISLLASATQLQKGKKVPSDPAQRLKETIEMLSAKDKRHNELD
jgi:hypothetical protein